MVLLPPEILNADGLFLDDMTIQELENLLKVPVMVFDGSWEDVFARLRSPQRSDRPGDLLPLLNPQHASHHKV
jgi:hypothetical protein